MRVHHAVFTKLRVPQVRFLPRAFPEIHRTHHSWKYCIETWPPPFPLILNQPAGLNGRSTIKVTEVPKLSRWVRSRTGNQETPEEAARGFQQESPPR